MLWLLQGDELTDEHEERAFLGGLTEARLFARMDHVFLEMEENNSQVQGRVLSAFPEAERVEGTLAVYFETAPLRRAANTAVLGDEP